LLCEICKCEAALVLQNHSAALWLAMAALSNGKEVIVSRGEVVDIEGVPLPNLVTAAAATLREVGSTHHTVLADYAQAGSASTGLILRLQPTEYAIVGTQAAGVPLEDLAPLARQLDRPLVHDLGYGGVLDVAPFGLPMEPTAQSSIGAGADLVVLSGDKLLGGPRCGILVGRRALIDKLTAHPLAALLSADKLALAALAGTLRLYRQPDVARRDLPLLRLLETPMANLRGRAERLAPQLSACPAVNSVEVLEEVTYLGSAQLPSRQLATICLAIEPASGSAERLAANLRSGPPAVVGRLKDGRFCFDLRSVIPRHDMLLIEAVTALKPPAEAPTGNA